jgi:FtsP/CotA-like multicopper oxidase with cupredoxin domain
MLSKLLVAGVALTLLLAGGTAAAGAWLWNRAALSTVGEVEFINPLAIPPLADSRIDEQGRRVFDLAATAGDHDYGQGSPVASHGFNGDHLGPTLRAERGERVVVNVHNQLAEPTTVHWHGMHLPAIMDGGPHQPVAPGQTWSPSWRIDQPAATLWYHPHPHGQTEKHVYRGLAGMFLLDDPETGALDLPDEYGVDDIPVIVQDKKFDRGGQLDDRPNLFSDVGVLGDTVAVNGTVGGYLDVTTEQVRLRLVNASTARTYHFGFADNRTFALIGSDGGLLAAPHETERIMLSPGERAEIVVRMQPGEQTVLRSYPAPLGVDHPGGRFSGRDDTLDVLQLRAADRLRPSSPLPERLVEVPRLDPADASQVRELRLAGRTINGESMDMRRIDFAVEAGSVEIWQIRNTDGTQHNFHLHDVQFQVVDVDGHPPPPELAGWKDTIFLRPGVRVEIIARFADYADPRTPYMFHCHLLNHEDSGMMGQFVVVEPGQPPETPDLPASHDH